MENSMNDAYSFFTGNGDITDSISYAAEIMHLGNKDDLFTGIAAAHALSVMYDIGLQKEVNKCVDFLKHLSENNSENAGIKLLADMNLMNIYAVLKDRPAFDEIVADVEMQLATDVNLTFADSIHYYRLSDLARFEDAIPNIKAYTEEFVILMDQFAFCPELVDDVCFTFLPILKKVKDTLSASKMIEIVRMLIAASNETSDKLSFYEFMLYECKLDKKQYAEMFHEHYELLLKYYRNNAAAEELTVKNQLMSYQIERRFIKNASTDTLTGLGNRYAYKSGLQRAQEKLTLKHKKTSNLIISVADINGLKYTNDTFGHQAGDELIRNAADCLKQVFGNIGELYRIGGDEFTIIMNAEPEIVDSCIERLKDLTGQVECHFGEQLHIAIGYATAKEIRGVSVEEIVDLADKRMYTDKDKYYEITGLPRR